jgi:copper resistance protein B
MMRGPGKNRTQRLTATALLVGLLTSQGVLAQTSGKTDLDPLQRVYPRIYRTTSGAPPKWPAPAGDTDIYHFLLIDRLEAGFGGGEDIIAWDGQGWIGGDWNKLWVKTEGEGVQGESPEDAEIQALYSRTISPFWDFQAGARYDIRPKPERAHAVIGVQGLAPQWFEVDAAAFISNKGDATFRVEVEYEWLLTQRLILQPRVEINAAAQSIPELGLGSGINYSEMGLRLRYEFRREFAPYIGVSWKKTWGDTADLARAGGAETSSLYFVTGLRLWY